MKNNNGKIRLIITFACCIVVMLIFIINNPFIITKPTSKNTNTKGNLFFPTFENNAEKNNVSSIIQNSSNTSIIKENDESKAVSASQNIKGKIIEKFITPYTANTSYNNVYLKNNTGISINLKEILNSKIKFSIEKNDKPQVLIMHTHTTESFMREDRDYYTDKDNARTTDEKYNNIMLGKIISDKLNSSGIKTLHDKTMHDYPEYNGSYTRSAATVKEYLKKYPDIKIVIDLHRDAVSSGESDKVKLCTEINGKKAAQIMLVMGSQSGTIKNYPNWKENLSLAVKLQQTVEVKYPTLARSILFVSRNYNQSLTTGSMLIEIGTEANTIDEVCYSAELLADSLTELLNRLE